MRKNVVITGLLLVACAILFPVCIYGYATDTRGMDLSFPIAFGILCAVFAYMLYFFVKNEEFPLTRIRLKKTLKFCKDTQNDDGKKVKKLEKFLNSRHILFLKSCPVCDKTLFNNGKPCPRCKTLFDKSSEKFTFECKGISRHRLAHIYSRDYKELSNLIAIHKPQTNVSDVSTGGGSITVDVNITITHN